MHSLVVGPGLGRHPLALDTAASIMSAAALPTKKGGKVLIVVDADGLFLVSRNLSLVFGQQHWILTPNKVGSRSVISM